MEKLNTRERLLKLHKEVWGSGKEQSSDMELMVDLLEDVVERLNRMDNHRHNSYGSVEMPGEEYDC